ncbi:MAG: hypothetical protein M2R45_02041 [Verrucomicrobia subdivision 3 bacterium]|nr:hypothetical protein [Limisphaerales bacterium]MCS1414861.1 hypothetical protein [Limisphaerales bacterium]
MTQNEHRILFLCGIGHFFAHFYMLMFPSLALWTHQDFQLSLPETLNLGFAMYLLFGFVSLPMGLLADRYGHRPLLVVMFLGLGFSSVAAGLSRSPVIFGVMLAGIGFFASIYHPVGIGLISKCCQNRGHALGNNGVWGNLGIGLAPLCAGLGAYVSDWRIVYLIVGVVVAVVGVVLWRLQIDEEPIPRTNALSPGATGRHLSYFALMLVSMCLLGLCYRGTVVSIPAYFKEHIHFLGRLLQWEGEVVVSASQSFGTTLLVSGIYLFGIFGQMTGGRLADRLDLRMAYLIFHACALPFMVLMGVLSELPLFLVGLGYLFFSLGMQPIENSLVARLTPNHLRSLAYGLKFILVLGVGAFAVKIVRWVLNHHEPQLVYFIQSGLILSVILLVAVIYWLSRRESFRNM